MNRVSKFGYVSFGFLILLASFSCNKKSAAEKQAAADAAAAKVLACKDIVCGSQATTDDIVACKNIGVEKERVTCTAPVATAGAATGTMATLASSTTTTTTVPDPTTTTTTPRM